jgi:signal transduction histidine kinase
LGTNKHTDAIKEDLLEMEQMISFILESARLSEGKLQMKLEKIPLKKFVEEVVNYHKKKNIPINYQSELPERCVFFHKNHLTILMNNLIQNAARYSSDTILVKSKILGNNFILVVQDYGVGIAKEDLPKITEAFYRVDESRSRKSGGYGLGLNICQGIVDAHQGTLEIASELGRGTKVKIIFPLKKNDPT